MVNFITKLPLITGKDIILIVYDMLSKITHFMATIEGISAEELARLFKIMCGSCMNYQRV